MSVLNQKFFHNEAAAFAKLESIVWPEGPVCPHCGCMGRVYDLGKTRIGLKKCGECRKQFTARVGTVMESSHVEVHKWLQAIYLMCASKKGFSAKQLERTLEVTYKTAWFMAHRIREAMREGDMLPPLGGEGLHVEADETYIGKKDALPAKRKKRAGGADKLAVLALVERGGRVRSFHIESADKGTVGNIVAANIARESTLQTDESRLYGDVGRTMAAHEKVRHTAGEYVRGTAYTNTVEGCFSIFKRGMRGVYQHCKEKHLHRYLAEFDFRYNEREALGVDDGERMARALKGIVGKRLTYRGPVNANAA